MLFVQSQTAQQDFKWKKKAKRRRHRGIEGNGYKKDETGHPGTQEETKQKTMIRVLTFWTNVLLFILCCCIQHHNKRCHFWPIGDGCWAESKKRYPIWYWICPPSSTFHHTGQGVVRVCSFKPWLQDLCKTPCHWQINSKSLPLMYTHCAL